MTLTPSHTPAAAAAAAVRIPVLPGVPADIDSTDVVVQMVRRAASPGFESWWQRAEGAGFCANPIHLIGTDAFGRQHQVLTRCNNRRAVACPSCSDLYARDTWQLIHAGLHGGHHDMPTTVAEHPQVFATLTAPSFGAVHTTGDDRHGKHARRCHDPGRRGFTRCQHGKPLWCSTIHSDHDARVGQPLCEDCYDYTGHVLFAWHAPELWRRFTITLRRLLGSHLRAIGEPAKSVRLNYVKVAELQRRAIPHFHAVIRLDAPPVPGEPPMPPVSSITAADLAVLVQRAALGVTVTRHRPWQPRRRRRDGVLRFGTQTDTQPLEPTSGTGSGEVRSCAVAPVGGSLSGEIRDEIGGRIRCRHPTDVPVSRRRIGRQHPRAGHPDHYHRPGRPPRLRGDGPLAPHPGVSGAHHHQIPAVFHHHGLPARVPRHLDPPTTHRPSRDNQGCRGSSGDGEIDANEWEFDRVGLCSLGERVLILSAAQRMIEHRHTVRDHLRAHDPPLTRTGLP